MNRTEAQARRDVLDQVVLLVVQGVAETEVREECATKLGITDKRAIGRLIAQAKKKITIAAQFNRDHEVGQARIRLNQVYAKADKEGDQRTALAAAKELNKLLDLYAAAPRRGEDDAEAGGQGPGARGQGSEGTVSSAADELAKVRAHLLPLGLAGPDYPIHEVARIAAERIRGSGVGDQGPGKKTE
ncbi:MAG: hypothetical protein ACYSVY_22065 [Planctomycetota bacterium]|jgi:hypothetical protein